MPDQVSEQIFCLWDEMADFDVAESDAALQHLLTSLCRLVDADNAGWIVGVCIPDIVQNDPAKGWRPRQAGYLHVSEAIRQAGREQTARLESGRLDASTIKNISLIGRWRANRLVDLVGPEWFDSEYYQRFYRAVGHVDAIWAGCPISSDVEIYFSLFRGEAKPPFSEDERERVAQALRGLKWFYRRYVLSYGLLVAKEPLTRTERQVLQGLLEGKAEKQVAADLSQSAHTTHQHVKSIYRKYGVRNRASLMTLWLGRDV